MIDSGNSQKIESTIAMLRNFSPEKPISNAVVYFWESHTRNPDDRKRTQATVDLIYKLFDMSTCEKYEVRTGYLSRYNYLSRPLENCTANEINEAIRKGKKEQEDWIARCAPDLPGFTCENWEKCISKEKNPHYENCRNLVIKKMKSDADFSNAFAKSVSEFALNHDTDKTNGNLYVIEEASWVLSLALLHLNKPIYLVHIGSANSAIVAMFHHFPNLQRAVKWLSPRFSISEFENVSDFLLDYRNAAHVGHSYAVENRESVKTIALFKKENKSILEELLQSLTNERSNNNLLNAIIEKLPSHVYWLNRDNIYLGCNDLQAYRLGLKSRNEIIGKTNYDLHVAHEAEKLNEINKMVMETGNPYEGEELASMQRGFGNYLSHKTPLFDPHGKVIGLLGVSIDITDRKKAEELLVKNKIQEARIEAQKEFGTFTAQVLHDIVSPLSSMESIIKSSDIPEKHHVTLKDITTSVKNIVGALSSKYREYEREADSGREGLILVALALEDAVRSKKYQYKATKIRFNYSFDPANKFTFIKGDQLSFGRMMSNLMNNAVEACDDKSGIVDISFNVEDKYAKIVLKDNGSGMSQEMANKIKTNLLGIDSTKHKGHGIGLLQVLTTLDSYNGILDIESEKNVGTTFIIKFPLVDCPKWIAKRLIFRKGDTVVILDDDPSVFSIFENLLKDYSKDLDLKFFTKSRDALDFIESFREKEKLCFLSDYELRNDDFNGLTVILQSGIKEHSLIITNIHGDKTIHEVAEQSNVKILPKRFLSDTQVTIE